MTVAEKLAQGIDGLRLHLPDKAQDHLVRYLALLAKWNRTHNLTAVRDPDAMVSLHVLDSLAVLAHLKGESVADVGSGGGLPGIPIAIARPTWRVVLVESNQKKAAFLEQCRIELALDNLGVEHRRVESWRPAEVFSEVISRAFSDLAEFVRLSSHLVGPGGSLVAMKGVHPYEEIAQLPPTVAVAEIVPLQVPGLDAARHLIVMRKN
jgi:16S rRNA (guanine527-N7)-methyltransferase